MTKQEFEVARKIYIERMNSKQYVAPNLRMVDLSGLENEVKYNVMDIQRWYILDEKPAIDWSN